jgi:DNA sulfur modification protein DndB
MRRKKSNYCGNLFTAIRGCLSTSEIFVALVPVTFLVKNFEFPNDDIPAEQQYQRNFNASHAGHIANYILNSQRFFFGAIVASIDAEQCEFTSIDDSDIGTISVPDGASIKIHDGQHRRKAWELALQENPELKNQTMPVVLYWYESIEMAQQILTDLNANGIRINSSVNVLFDHREKENLLTKKVIKTVDQLEKLVEMKENSLSSKSGKLFTLKNVADITVLLCRYLDHREFDELVEINAEFWRSLFAHMFRWQQVAAGKLAASEVRKEDTSTWAVTLYALGSVGQSLVTRYADSLDSLNPALADLAEIDWSRSNPDWSELFIFNGKVVNNSNSKKKLTAYFKQKIGVSLTEEEEALLNL